MTELKQYYKQIHRKLPCSGSHRKRLLADLQSSVDNYIAEHPGTDLQAVEEHFGTPEQIAASYSAEMDTGAIVKRYRLRKWIITIAAATAAVALALWLTTLIVALFNVADDADGHIETGSVIIEEEVNE